MNERPLICYQLWTITPLRANSATMIWKTLYGTDIPSEVFDKAVKILRHQLGFDSTDQQSATPSKSKLSLNKQSSSSKALLPVDAECEDQFKATASSATSNKWSAFSKSQCTSFRAFEKEWQDLFSTPIPQAAKNCAFCRFAGLYWEIEVCNGKT